MFYKISLQKTIISLVVVMMTALSFFSSNTCFVVEGDTYRGVFQKQQAIINYGLELMDMEDSKAFEIYMSMLEVTTSTTELRVDFETPILLESKKQEDITKLDKDKLTKISEDAQIAMDAFIKDYPEVFWIDISSSSGTAIIAKKTLADGSTEYLISGIKLKLKVSDTFAGDVEQSYDELLNELNSVVAYTKGLTRYDKLKYFHDYLCTNIEYSLDGENIFDMYGAIIHGQSVCEGYAEAFKALCDLSGIPCVLVSGESVNVNGNRTNHMWNYCLMEDDKWYAVDITWDDSSEILYEYFLVGGNTLSEIYNMSFNETHIANGDFSFSGYHSFTYPVLNDEAYEVKVYPNPDNVVIGDVNYDGEINSSDALEILKISARLKMGNEYELVSGDIDGNDVMESSDALYVLKYAARLITEFPVTQ